MINYYSGFFISFILHLGLIFSFSNYFSIDFLSYEKDITSIPAYVIYEKEQVKTKSPKRVKELNLVEANKLKIVEDNKEISSILERLDLKRDLINPTTEKETKNTDLEKVMYFSSVIRDQIMSNWREPKSSKVGLKTEFIISLVPTGEVIDVNLTKSSGDKAFDQSALLAINKVNRFYDLEMPRKLFDENFRKFTVVFSPKE
ncbi:MAG: TonB family protein [Pseudomonadota bacterium]|nr:TonB family protein [Pseudomonadota bacterium]